MKEAGRAWGVDETQRLKTHWAEGLSASQCAIVLAKEGFPKRTRNSVIGRVHRVGLKGRVFYTNAHVNKKRPRRQRIAIPAPSLRAPEKAPPLGRELAHIKALPPVDPTLDVLKLNEFTCRFPIGDPVSPDFAFCGRTCEATYCSAHAKLCYVPVKKRTHDGTLRLANWIDSRTFKVMGV